MKLALKALEITLASTPPLLVRVLHHLKPWQTFALEVSIQLSIFGQAGSEAHPSTPDELLPKQQVSVMCTYRFVTLRTKLSNHFPKR